MSHLSKVMELFDVWEILALPIDASQRARSSFEKDNDWRSRGQTMVNNSHIGLQDAQLSAPAGIANSQLLGFTSHTYFSASE